MFGEKLLLQSPFLFLIRTASCFPSSQREDRIGDGQTYLEHFLLPFGHDSEQEVHVDPAIGLDIMPSFCRIDHTTQNDDSARGLFPGSGRYICARAAVLRLLISMSSLAALALWCRLQRSSQAYSLKSRKMAADESLP
jgi:hypothetical protein